MKTCGNCQAVMLPHDLFCGECGAKFTSGTAPETARETADPTSGADLSEAPPTPPESIEKKPFISKPVRWVSWFGLFLIVHLFTAVVTIDIFDGLFRFLRDNYAMQDSGAALTYQTLTFVFFYVLTSLILTILVRFLRGPIPALDVPVWSIWISNLILSIIFQIISFIHMQGNLFQIHFNNRFISAMLTVTLLLIIPVAIAAVFQTLAVKKRGD